MKARLLYPERDADWRWASPAAELRDMRRTGRRAHDLEDFHPDEVLAWNAEALVEDLGLDALFAAMGGDADDIHVVVRRELLTAASNDLETIEYRQAMLGDAIRNPDVVRRLHALATEGMAIHRKHYLGRLLHDYPDSVLRWAIDLLSDTLGTIASLRTLAATSADRFTAAGWQRLFAMIQADLGEDYVARLTQQLTELRLRDGIAMSAALGGGNRPRDYRLHQPPVVHETWLQRFLRRWFPSFFREELGPYSFSIAPSDESGNRALREFSNRGVAIAAQALGDAALHIRDFFEMLRAESAFYVGGVTLHEQLQAAGLTTCMPDMSRGEPNLDCEGLYEPSLGLATHGAIVGNDIHADGRTLVVITGANQGGKSTLLRAIGVAQIMAQCGLFVPARHYGASLSSAIVTHYKREEDTALVSGKFEEELARMSQIVDHFEAGTLLLLNESFASTTEQEGSEIADEAIETLRAAGGRVVFVTHLYEYAHRAAQRSGAAALFLRAERDEAGERSFRILEGAPLRTSFGEDLYQKIFKSASQAPASPL